MRGINFIQILVFLSITTVIIAVDLYKVLELTPDASDQDIRKAFKKLSIQYHPDKNPGSREAHQKYLDINRAHEILTDSETRQIYDLYGEEGLNDRNSQFRNRQKGQNAHVDISVTLEQLYNGDTKDFTFQKKIICKFCKGSGSKDGKMQVCKTCKGSGIRLQNVNIGIGYMQMQTTCDRCGGKGQTSAGNCPTCFGQKVVPQTKTLKIDIERGMSDGQQIVFKGESEQNPDYLPGDVIFTLKQDKHPSFVRQNNDLHLDIRLTLKESILGFKKRIRHLDNHYVDIESRNVIQPFQTKIITGEGMPMHQFASSKGDLIIHYIVDIPKKFTDADKKLIKSILSSK